MRLVPRILVVLLAAAAGGFGAPGAGKDDSEMVLVPAGEFVMGSARYDGEKPERRLNLPAFTIDKYEVTNEQYAQFLNAVGKTADARGPWIRDEGLGIYQVGGKWKPFPGAEKRPMVNVSWYGAAAYAAWAGKRLPTEAEWEKAARGTDGRAYPWGDEWDATKCNTAEKGPKKSTPVGAYPRDVSPYGCLDMAGNVWEWTSSAFDDYPYNAKDGREDPKRDDPRVVRGGGWFTDDASNARCAARGGAVPGERGDCLGFRCARSAPE